MRTIYVSPDFPLNRWGLIVVVMLAIVFALPVFAEEESSNANLEWAWDWLVKLLPDVVTGVVTGVVTVCLAAWRGLKNFRKGMLHNKKAEIYERLLEALHAQIDAYDTMEYNDIEGARRNKHTSPEEDRAEKNKAKKAEEKWFRAISVSELYFPPKSVDILREHRINADKEILEIEKEERFMTGRSEPLKKLAKEVQKQARKDIEVGK